MSTEKTASKMIPQTVNLMSSGGCSHEALTAGDIQGLMMSIEATPLIWSFFEAKYEIQPIDQFKHKLVYWLFNRLINQQQIEEDYLIEHHITLVNAAHNLSEGLGNYLARHKIKDDAVSPYFRYLDVQKRQFNRKYAPFINDCIADLQQELHNLEESIKERTKY